MSVTLTPSLPVSTAPTTAMTKPMKRWLVGSWFDLLFLANLGWPIAALAAFWFLPPAEASTSNENILSLFQIYFLSTPHRWITLVLVFCDSERFWKEPVRFGGIGLGLIALALILVGVAGYVPNVTSSLTLLMMIDYIWNAWHFAAQHAGISRIYGRISRPDQTAEHGEFEKMALRTLVLWVFLRFAVHMATLSPYADGVAWITPWLPWLDPLPFIPCAILLVREISSVQGGAWGRVLYIGSVITLYTGQLLAIRIGHVGWMTAFFFAGAVFHSVEYLAVCNWSVQKRTTGIWKYQVTRTGIAVVFFMLGVGLVNYFVNAQSVYAWQLITLLVSYLHYAYDGIIWRAKK